MNAREYDQRELAILGERTRRLAQPKKAVAAHDDTLGVLVCEVGSVELGIPTTQIEIVMVAPPITTLPSSSDVLLGIVQVRGAVQAVIDIARWLGVERRSVTGQVVVVHSAGRRLALLIDRAQALRTITDAEVAKTLGKDAPGALPVRAVTHSLVSILDVDRLFSHPRVDVGARGSSVSKENPSCD